MPTYEYACVDCGNRFEIFQRIGDEPPTTCEICGGVLRKVFYPVGVVLKGAGFYKTDSRPARTEEGAGKKKDAKEPTKTKKPAGEKKEKSA